MQLHDLTVSEASDLLDRQQLTAVELTTAVLARIEQAEPLVNACIEIMPEEAIDAARCADKARARRDEPHSPLRGIPVAVKDNLCMKGHVTSAGSRIFSERAPDDAPAIACLRKAGVVFVARTNLDEFAAGATTSNPHYGQTSNPWNVARTPGGSSGGSAAALAVGECLLALGTDSGGSVRIPAALTGVLGLRPTYGYVSTDGVVPYAWSLDTVGPFSRRAEDAALVMDAIAVPSRSRLRSRLNRSTGEQLLSHGLRGVTLGIVEDYSMVALQQPVRQAVEVALGEFEALGAEICEVALEHVHDSIAAAFCVALAEASAFHAAWLEERPNDYGAEARSHFELGQSVLATQYLQAQRYRSALIDELLGVLNSVDAIVTPTVPFTAPVIGEGSVRFERGRTGAVIPEIVRFTEFASLAGFPALSVPCGLSPDGLPIGMQLVGRPFADRDLLFLATAYENVTGWHRLRPKFVQDPKADPAV